MWNKRNLDFTKEIEQKKTILAKDKEYAALFPGNFLVDLSASGSVESKLAAAEGDTTQANFNLSFTIRLLEDKWTKIPLSSSLEVLGQTKIFYINISNIHSDTPEKIEIPITHPHTFIFEDRNSSEIIFATNQSGTYQVEMQLHTLLRSSRSVNTLSLSRLIYPLRKMNLRLLHPSNSRPVLREFNIIPLALYNMEQNSENCSCTDISMRMAPTHGVEFKWRGEDQNAQASAGVEDRDIAQADIPQATVSHDTLHSINEGVLQSTHVFNYEVDSEASAFNKFDITIPPNVRVVSVSSLDIRNWKVLQHQNNTVLRVSFKSTLVSDRIQLVVNTEIQLDPNSDLVNLPSLVCRDVLRQTGHFGVVKVVNVELYSNFCEGAASADPIEVSSFLRHQTSKAIVMAFKFLSPHYNVSLQVLRHAEVDVLEASVDHAAYQALVVDTHIMHSYTLSMQNTNRQYLSLQDLPASFKVWSLFVNNLPTQPVKNGKDTQSILIPLLPGSGVSNDGSCQTYTVELTYVSTHDPLGEAGNITILPPKIDLPISVMTAEIEAPPGYNWEWKSAGLQQVSKFSHKKPMTVNSNKDKHVVSSTHDFRYVLEDTDTAGKSVRVKVPTTGRSVKFERLLVIVDTPSLLGMYVTPPLPTTNNSLIGKLLSLLR